MVCVQFICFAGVKCGYGKECSTWVGLMLFEIYRCRKMERIYRARNKEILTGVNENIFFSRELPFRLYLTDHCESTLHTENVWELN